MPCSARISLATFRISAWGVGEAATFRVVPASSLVSAVDSAASEEAAVLSVEAASEDAAAESVEAEEPQAASDRAREAASVAEISFFMVNSPLYIVRCVGFERSASLRASHSHTGLLVNGTSFHSHKLPFQTKAGCRLSGIPLQVFITRCNLRTRKLAQDAYASCTCTSSYQSRLHSWFCTPFLNFWSALFAFHGSQYTPVNRFCQHLFA